MFGSCPLVCEMSVRQAYCKASVTTCLDRLVAYSSLSCKKLAHRQNQCDREVFAQLIRVVTNLIFPQVTGHGACTHDQTRAGHENCCSLRSVE